MFIFYKSIISFLSQIAIPYVEDILRVYTTYRCGATIKVGFTQNPLIQNLVIHFYVRVYLFHPLILVYSWALYSCPV